MFIYIGGYICRYVSRYLHIQIIQVFTLVLVMF